jgi:hypothetical protein
LRACARAHKLACHHGVAGGGTPGTDEAAERVRRPVRMYVAAVLDGAGGGRKHDSRLSPSMPKSSATASINRPASALAAQSLTGSNTNAALHASTHRRVSNETERGREAQPHTRTAAGHRGISWHGRRHIFI